MQVSLLLIIETLRYIFFGDKIEQATASFIEPTKFYKIIYLWPFSFIQKTVIGYN